MPPLPGASPDLPRGCAALAQALLLVLTDGSLRDSLQAAARQTALRFAPSAVLQQLEDVLYSLTAAAGELLQLRAGAQGEIHAACLWAAEACTRPQVKH